MELLSYAIISFIVFLGIIAGYGLSLIAPEEIRPGRMHLKFFYSILVGLIIALTMRSISPILSWIAYIIIIIVVFQFKYVKYLYPVMGIFLYISIGNYFNYVAPLLFMLGLPVSSMESHDFVKDDKIKNKAGLLLLVARRYIWIIPVSLLPFLISYL